MKQKIRVLVTFIFIIILVVGLYTFTNWFSLITGYLKGEDEAMKLATCMSQKGAEFYTNDFCADCEKQEKLFGKSFSLIRQIDCGREKENCPNIREIPAWYIDKNIYYGLKTIDELKDISNCNEE